MTSAASRLALVAGLVLFALPASAAQLNTGGSGGAYTRASAQPLVGQLKLAQFDYQCTPSSGTRENMERVLADPRQLGYGQLDVFVLEARQLKAETAFVIARQDDVRECVFAVTRNRDIGQLRRAGRLRRQAALHPAAARLRQRRHVPVPARHRCRRARQGQVGQQRRVDRGRHPRGAVGRRYGQPVRAVRRSRQRAFELVRKLGGHLVPVIDRNILRQEVNGKKIYFAQETQVENAQWIKQGRKLVTACTPVVLFTGHPERVQGEQARKDHEDLIRTIGDLKPGSLLPRSRCSSGSSSAPRSCLRSARRSVLEATEEARQKARPYTDKALEAAKETVEQAKQATERATEAAKPYIDKSKEAAQKAYDDAMKAAKDLMDKSKSDPAKKN